MATDWYYIQRFGYYIGRRGVSVSTFDISSESFLAAQDEFGEEVFLIRNKSYPFTGIFTEKFNQVFDVKNGNMVDTVQLFVDLSVMEMKNFSIYPSNGEKIKRKDKFYTVVEVQERTGFQRCRLHQEQPSQTARAW